MKIKIETHEMSVDLRPGLFLAVASDEHAEPVRPVGCFRDRDRAAAEAGGHFYGGFVVECDAGGAWWDWGFGPARTRDEAVSAGD